MVGTSDGTQSRIEPMCVATGSGDAAATSTLLQQRFAQPPQRADEHYRLARLLAGSGKHSEAIETLKRCVALSPDYGQALFALGRGLLHGGFHAQAVLPLRMAAAEMPDSAPVFFHLANALLRSHSKHGLAPVLRRAAQLSPVQSQLWFKYQLARRYQKLARDEEAEALLAAIDKSGAEAVLQQNALHGRVQLALRRFDFERAEVLSRRLLVLAPAEASYHLLLLDSLCRAHRFTEALEHVESSPVVRGISGLREWIEGAAHFAKGNLDKAARLFRVAAAKNGSGEMVGGHGVRGYKFIEEAERNGARTQVDPLFLADARYRQHDSRLVFVVSCNDVYLQIFGDRLFRSIAEFGPGCAVHVHLVNPSPAAVEMLTAFRSRYRGLDFEASSSRTSSERQRGHSAIARYLIAPDLLDSWRRPLLILDMDACIAAPIDVIQRDLADCDVALYCDFDKPFPWEVCCANFVYLKPTPAGRLFAWLAAVCMERLADQGVQWTHDQMSLLLAHHALRDRLPNVQLRELTAHESSAFAINSGSYKKRIVARRNNPNLDIEINLLEAVLTELEIAAQRLSTPASSM
ncbi:MAG: tetratricopeptide repeat protein [Alphaproteobacteria bacterium]|nr:tetratricopeptide repeat protein [Alphaproteobacteria bacterium]